MARFLNGLMYPIKKIVEFQPYESLVELVHQAMKAERQVAEELKYVKAKSFFANKASSSTQPMTQVHAQSNVKGATTQPPTTFKKTAPSPQAAKSYVTCYKCGGQGHKSFECTNKKVMIVCNVRGFSQIRNCLLFYFCIIMTSASSHRIFLATKNLFL